MQDGVLNTAVPPRTNGKAFVSIWIERRFKNDGNWAELGRFGAWAVGSIKFPLSYIRTWDCPGIF